MIFFPWNYGFSFSSSFSTQNSPLVFLSSLNTMIHITNCISFIILKKFLLEMFRLLTLHHWYPAVISGLLCHHLGVFFSWPSFISYLIYFSLLLSSFVKKAKTRNKITYPSNFPPAFSIYNIFIDFPVVTNVSSGWLCNTETKMNTHPYFTFYTSACIFYNSSSVKLFFFLHFKVIIDLFKILWSCKDKSVAYPSLVSSNWLHLR